MIQHHKNKANIGILIGLGLSIGGRIWSGTMPETEPMQAGALMLQLVGLIVFVFGCVQYALAKGRSGWWGLFGLLSLIGLIVLVVLKDYSDERIRPQGFPVQPIPRR